MNCNSTVLVIDDDPGILALISRLLEDDGFNVHTARTGIEGLVSLDYLDDRVSVIVLDVQMPVMDGVGFCSEARRRGYNIPTLLLSSNERVHVIARELHVDASLGKPFDLEELCSTVKTLATKA